MTEEEKKAIDKLKSWKSYMEKDEDEMEVIDTISNLIEKLQKEIKYIRDKNQDLVEENSTKDGDYEELKDNFNEYKANSIPKDKIREKINELEENIEKCLNENQSFWTDYSISLDFKEGALRELLEEEQE